MSSIAAVSQPAPQPGHGVSIPSELDVAVDFLRTRATEHPQRATELAVNTWGITVVLFDATPDEVPPDARLRRCTGGNSQQSFIAARWCRDGVAFNAHVYGAALVDGVMVAR